MIMNMKNKSNTKEINFLTELKELCEKYNYYLGGCGCCGSPYIYDYDNDEYLLDNVEINHKVKCSDNTNKVNNDIC